jgi:hypothetical protein
MCLVLGFRDLSGGSELLFDPGFVAVGSAPDQYDPEPVFWVIVSLDITDCGVG